MAEDLIGVILRRSSCRDFLPDALEEGVIEKLLEVMQRAPSAGNLQPWHFYAVTNSKLKESLAEAAHGQRFIAKAPVAFVACAVPERSGPRYGNRGRNLYCIQDTAAAVENLLLAAEALELGACWVGAFSEEAASKALELPPEQRPVAIVPVGRPAGESWKTSRLPLSEVATFLQ